jgi:1-acyl-sn-glycerol-3-phosphate acyltransferase
MIEDNHIYKKRKLYYILCKFFALFFEGFYQVEIFGIENIPHKGGFLLASNHTSFFDPPLIEYHLFRPLYSFARSTLFCNRLLGGVLKRLNAIPVDSNHPLNLKTLKHLLRLLQKGNGLLLFPEGVRSPDGNLQKAKPGIGFLACRSQVTVIPARIFGTFKAYSRHRKSPSLGYPLSVVYGPPLTPADYDIKGHSKQRYEKASKKIMDSIQAIQLPNPNVF